MASRTEQDASHALAVRAYYETNDEAHLGPVLAELRPRLVAFIGVKLGQRDPNRVADLVQETFARVLPALRNRKYTIGGSLPAWVFTICRNEFLRQLNSRKGRPSAPNASDDPFQFLTAEVATAPKVLALTAEDEATAEAYLGAVTQALGGLDRNARACIELHYCQSVPVVEAAQLLGIPELKFRERLRRGMGMLRAWASQYAAPSAEVYAALRGVDSGELFDTYRLAS